MLVIIFNIYNPSEKLLPYILTATYNEIVVKIKNQKSIEAAINYFL